MPTAVLLYLLFLVWSLGRGKSPGTWEICHLQLAAASKIKVSWFGKPQTLGYSVLEKKCKQNVAYLIFSKSLQTRPLFWTLVLYTNLSLQLKRKNVFQWPPRCLPYFPHFSFHLLKKSVLCFKYCISKDLYGSMCSIKYKKSSVEKYISISCFTVPGSIYC